MDPDENLKEMRMLVMGIIKANRLENEIDPDDAARLAELVDALDRWITKGGFMPAHWQRYSPREGQTPMKAYEELASLVVARRNCIDDKNLDWLDKHTERIQKIVKDYMPSGSGFDNGVKLNLDLSNENKLVFETSYHHMNEVGSYDGWTEHTITVTPSLAFSYRLKISGRNRNNIKEHIGETFGQALDVEIPRTPAASDLFKE